MSTSSKGSKLLEFKKDSNEFRDQAGIGACLIGGIVLKTPLINSEDRTELMSMSIDTSKGSLKAHLYFAIVLYFLFKLKM